MQNGPKENPERSKGLVHQIRQAEARLKALNSKLEMETGVTEEEGMLLNQLVKMEWTDHVALSDLGIGWNMARNIKGVHGLKKKHLIDYEQEGGIRFRVNKYGKEALSRFKKELKQ